MPSRWKFWKFGERKQAQAARLRQQADAKKKQEAEALPPPKTEEEIEADRAAYVRKMKQQEKDDEADWRNNWIKVTGKEPTEADRRGTISESDWAWRRAGAREWDSYLLKSNNPWYYPDPPLSKKVTNEGSGVTPTT